MTTPLEISQLSKRFGSLDAVANVSFRVRAGTIHGLLGPNGSGKSTTLRCALGLLRADSGEASVLGESANRLARLRGRMGVAFDRPDLLDGATVVDNLDYAEKLSGLKSRGDHSDLLEAVGLTESATKRARQLSLGQKRRLAIARALLGEPEFVILDEPLSGLDTLGVRSMLELFRSLRAKGVTLLLSSHRLHEMETIVDSVSIMSKGRLVADQPLTELLAGRGKILAVVDDADRATALLGERLHRVEPQTVGLARLEIAAESAADINHELVQGGCRVHSLTTESTSLLGVFEALVGENSETVS